MWYQLRIDHCRPEEIELLSDELTDYGALAITLSDKNDDAILEPLPGETPLWPEVTVHVLFAQAEEAQLARSHLLITYPQLRFELEILKDKNWERVWMDDFKPQRFGHRLWICPTSCHPPDPEAVNLILDPGLAFGTGTHPTTAMCLTWLEQADLRNKSLLDYGCGSGILSLAALKLGARVVQAVDIDEQALQATANNAELNQIDKSQLHITDPKNLNPVDLIIANILLTPLIDLKERFYQLLSPQSYLIVSGLLAEQIPQLIEAYKPLFTAVETRCSQEWALIVFAN